MQVVTAAVMETDGKILIAKRRRGDHLEHKWELPGGKLESNETPEECLKRELHEELGIETVHRAIDRSELYTADECFLTGTAAHVTPVAEIDHRPIGNGEIGEITAKLQEIYARVIRGDHSKYMHWCTPVYKK